MNFSLKCVKIYITSFKFLGSGCMNKKKIFLIIFWFTLIISFECVYRMTIFKNIIDSDFIQMIVFCLPMASILYLGTTLFNEKVNKVISTIVVLLVYVIFFAQMVYFQVCMFNYSCCFILFIKK